MGAAKTVEEVVMKESIKKLLLFLVLLYAANQYYSVNIGDSEEEDYINESEEGMVAASKYKKDYQTVCYLKL